MRVLIIEDEEKIADLIRRSLAAHKFAIDIARDGEEGLYFARECPFDLIVLDIKLPKLNGLELCRTLRAEKIVTPVLMLTASSSVSDKVAGLDAGADDYLPKPFAIEEFLARVRALLRRQREEKRDVLQVDDLILNLKDHSVTRGGAPIIVTSKEYALLEYLMLHANQVVTRTMISEHVWNEEFNSFTNVIDVYIRYLRSKIDQAPHKKLIQTIRGTGYILKARE